MDLKYPLVKVALCWTPPHGIRYTTGSPVVHGPCIGATDHPNRTPWLSCKNTKKPFIDNTLEDSNRVLNEAKPVPTSTPPALVIRALGSFSVRGLHGAGLGDADSRMHAKALLALASSSRAGVVRDEVIDALWPSHADTAARNRLYHTMHLVRRSLSGLAWPADWIVLNHGRVQLDTSIDSDAAQLDAACSGSLEAVSDDALMHILQLCRGDWAPNVDAGGLGHTVRRHLRDCHAKVLHEAAARQAQRGDTPARRDLLRQILQQNPTDEWAYRQCMQLDLDAARPHAVLRTYEMAGRELAQQLGLKPSTALSELAWRASRVLEAADRGDLPSAAFSEPLVGREHEVRELVAALNEKPGLWNVSGLCGVGKSALMREVARRVAPTRPDGVRMATLGDGDGPDAVVATLLRGFGLESREGEDPVALLIEMARTRDMLLIVDDGDAMLGCQALMDLLDGRLTSRVVMVTRTPITDNRVRQVMVHPLALAEPSASIEQVRLSPAVMLFQMRRLNDDAPGDTDIALREVLDLVRQLDGLPLAIELAAARTATMTPGEILRQWALAPRPDAPLASTPPVVPPERHRSVGAAMDATLQLLSVQARQACMVAAAFPETFSERQWSDVAQGAQLHHLSPGLPLLDALAGVGLLTCDAVGRFRMLRLARTHAKQQAQRLQLWTAIEQARIDQVIAMLEDGETHHESSGYTAWMNKVAAMEDEVMAVLGHAQQWDDARFLRLLLPMLLSWALRRHSHVSLAWFEHGIKAASRCGDTSAELVVRVAYSIAFQYLKRMDDALAQNAVAMTLAKQERDPVLSVMAVVMQAYLHNALGRRGEGIALLNHWATELPLGSPGGITLHAALVTYGKTVPGLTPSSGEWKESVALRARYAGSQAWRNVLLAVDRCVPTLDPAVHVRIAAELNAMAMDMRTPWLAQLAQRRRAIAWLSMDHPEEAAEAAREWHRMASSEGMLASAGQACLFLAAMAWRTDDALAAALWLDQVPKLTRMGTDESLTKDGLVLARTIVASLQGYGVVAAATFLEIPRLALPSLAWPNLELALECGALLAKLDRAPTLQATFTTLLPIVTDPHKHSPMKKRFRERHLGLPMTMAGGAAPASMVVADDVASAAKRGRVALGDLHDALRAKAPNR
jgi:DNA-binding SARP family transcriptional activator/predicted ATPase